MFGCLSHVACLAREGDPNLACVESRRKKNKKHRGLLQRSAPRTSIHLGRGGDCNPDSREPSRHGAQLHVLLHQCCGGHAQRFASQDKRAGHAGSPRCEGPPSSPCSGTLDILLSCMRYEKLSPLPNKKLINEKDTIVSLCTTNYRLKTVQIQCFQTDPKY